MLHVHYSVQLTTGCFGKMPSLARVQELQEFCFLIFFSSTTNKKIICICLWSPKNTNIQITQKMSSIFNDNNWDWVKFLGRLKSFSHYCIWWMPFSMYLHCNSVDMVKKKITKCVTNQHKFLEEEQLIFFYLLLSRVMRNIRWIMWLTLSCSHNSCRERNERLISATESSFSSTLSDTEFSDSDWLSPESSTVGKEWKWPF